MDLNCHFHVKMYSLEAYVNFCKNFRFAVHAVDDVSYADRAGFLQFLVYVWHVLPICCVVFLILILFLIFKL